MDCERPSDLDDLNLGCKVWKQFDACGDRNALRDAEILEIAAPQVSEQLR